MKAIDKACEMYKNIHNTPDDYNPIDKQTITEYFCPNDFNIAIDNESKYCNYGGKCEDCDKCWNEEIIDANYSLISTLKTQLKSYIQNDMLDEQNVTIINEFIDFVKSNYEK